MDFHKTIPDDPRQRDRIRGCMLGGAIGDALGYPVEFLDEGYLFARYGPDGITDYELTDGKAQISDDTQMTLFTATGLLFADTRGKLRGMGGELYSYVEQHYQTWYRTQTMSMESAIQAEGYGGSWLKEVPELYARRAPGNTCLSALEAEYPPTRDYLNDPVNNSKGCGAIMRTAPVGLLYRVGFNAQEGTLKELDRAAAEIAALTHGHPLGYMPASVVTHIVNRLVTSGDTMTLRETVLEARSTMEELFAENPYLPELLEEIDLALELSQNQDSDLDNIHRLGEGWVAEETLGIALYCALKYQNDFSKAVAVAVNHRGDSDSTGAVTGNLLGALLGEQAIAPKWKEDLELRDVILELADDLYTGCRMSEHGTYRDDAWLDKYVYCRRPKGDTSSH